MAGSDVEDDCAMGAKVVDIKPPPSLIADPRDGLNGVTKRMTENRKQEIAPSDQRIVVATETRDTSGERSKARNRARDAANAAAKAVKTKTEIENEELRKHVNGVLQKTPHG